LSSNPQAVAANRVHDCSCGSIGARVFRRIRGVHLSLWGYQRRGGTEERLIRFLRTSVVAQRPTTGDAVPGPLAFCALRQQHGNGGGASIRRMALPVTYAEKRPANTDTGRRAFHRSAASGFMPLAQSEKCRGAGGRAPMAKGSTHAANATGPRCSCICGHAPPRTLRSVPAYTLSASLTGFVCLHTIAICPCCTGGRHGQKVIQQGASKDTCVWRYRLE
jgi:hypothetical protein